MEIARAIYNVSRGIPAIKCAFTAHFQPCQTFTLEGKFPIFLSPFFFLVLMEDITRRLIAAQRVSLRFPQVCSLAHIYIYSLKFANLILIIVSFGYRNEINISRNMT